MNQSAIFLPVLTQIGLTLFVFILLAIRKSAAVKAGGVDRQKAALDNSAWNKEVVQVSNNIANQFQTPVLFYILAIYFYSVAAVSTLVLGLAWFYVASRLVHAYVHVTSNYIPLRLASFTLGVLSLLVLTVIGFIGLLV